MEEKKLNVAALVVCIAVPMLVGFASAFLTGDMSAEYSRLVKPALAPPNWIFGIVWTVLYVLMGVATYLVLYHHRPHAHMGVALTLFAVQLVLNFLWSILFFRAGQQWIAFLVILALDAMVVLCVLAYWKITPLAGILLVPYLLWILFATYLNFAFALVN